MRIMNVGSVVRIPRSEKWTSKATIATIENDEEDVTLLMDYDIPTRSFGRAFIVTPTLTADSSDEVVLPKSQLQALKDFEVEKRIESSTTGDVEDASPLLWKERGDVLLKLGDASAAILFYEYALHLTHAVQVGATVLVKSGSESRTVAEVDCMDENDGAVDVTYPNDDEKEATLQLQDIILSISLHHSDLQVRVLLNLARSLLKLAEYKSISDYRQGAVLACSLAIAILSSQDEAAVSLTTTSLLLRSQAQASLGRFPAATRDVNQLLKLDSQHSQGRKWKQEISTKIKQQERSNKKLVKGMCQWIKNTTEAPDGVSATRRAAAPTTTTLSDPFLAAHWKYIVMVVLVAIWFYHYYN